MKPTHKGHAHEKNNMLKAMVISNGIGAEDAYLSNSEVEFETVQIGPGFAIDLTGYHLLVIPNGTDHVALFRNRDRIREFLDQGNMLFCFCGWFLDWVPGNRWIHDNAKATRDVRHFAGENYLNLLAGVDLAKLDHNAHGISGWWSCGYIEPANEAKALIHDTWGRALVVVDDVTTRGLMFLTASGPVGDYGRFGDTGPIGQIYENLIRFAVSRANEARLI